MQRRKVLITNKGDWRVFLSNSKTDFEVNWMSENKSICSKEDFKFLKTLGSGAFGKVVLARSKSDNTLYAIKILDKKTSMSSDNVDCLINERKALQATDFSFIIHMDFFFDDKEYLYFVMTYAAGGDLWRELRKRGKFPERTAKFFGCQIVLALEYLHFIDLIYRDIKPENILLDADGYVKLADLGFCKPVRGRTYTMCGTIEYIAPEIVLNHGYGLPADWWSFGVLLYEFCSGRTPFLNKNPVKLVEAIAAGSYVMHRGFSVELEHLISNLLKTDPTKRYGSHKLGIAEIREHTWFCEISWIDVLNKRVEPPFLPEQNVITDHTEENGEF